MNYTNKVIGNILGNKPKADNYSLNESLKEKKLRAIKTGKPIVLSISNTQSGDSDYSKDDKRIALPPGKRISKNGNIYYEHRKNRSDKKDKSV